MLYKNLVIRIEIKRMSELLGFPYYRELTMPIEDALRNKYIDEIDMEILSNGVELEKQFRISDEGYIVPISI